MPKPVSLEERVEKLESQVMVLSRFLRVLQVTVEEHHELMQSGAFSRVPEKAVGLGKIKEDGRCNGMTKDGKRCKIGVEPGEWFCATHAPQDPRTVMAEISELGL